MNDRIDNQVIRMEKGTKKGRQRCRPMKLTPINARIYSG
ncbi:hypothetical protein Pvag_3497 [Pantoea vagans C9-1]|nr:hypothetical protein Pvag_3497 [Pantoea vagans C9-1]